MSEDTNLINLSTAPIDLFLIICRSAIKGTVVLLPLLGVTWIVGVFAINSNTTAFLWIFTILNSLQVMVFIETSGLDAPSTVTFFFLLLINRAWQYWSCMFFEIKL